MARQTACSLSLSRTSVKTPPPPIFIPDGPHRFPDRTGQVTYMGGHVEYTDTQPLPYYDGTLILDTLQVRRPVDMCQEVCFSQCASTPCRTTLGLWMGRTALPHLLGTAGKLRVCIHAPLFLSTHRESRLRAVEGDKKTCKHHPLVHHSTGALAARWYLPTGHVLYQLVPTLSGLA